MSAVVPEDVLLVTMTAPTEAVAVALVQAAVKARLAACGNLMPHVRSIYRWQGELCDEAEVLVILKTTAAAFPRLRDQLVEQHPYDCPEVVAAPVMAGHTAYLDWVRENVG